MKLEKIVNAYPALSKLAGQDLPLPILYRFSKILAALEPEINFFMTQKEKLFEELGVIEDGCYTIPPENAEIFSEKVQALAEVETEITPSAIGLPLELPLIDGVSLSYNDLQYLENFVKLGGTDNARDNA